MGAPIGRRALVLGLAITGEAVVRQLRARHIGVVVVDDRPTDVVRARAAGLDVALVEAPDTAELGRLLDDVDLVLPSPGVPAHHPVFALAGARRQHVWSEFELAARWSNVPLVAITGTNGKTTVTTLVADMLRGSGLATIAAGNTDVPLIDVVDRGLDVVVVEASSFRLQLTETFRPAVAAWLNLAEDHLDWHPTMTDYAAAKARIWANQAGDDLAIVNADDPQVMAAAIAAPARVQRFSISNHADWWLDRPAGRLVGPDNVTIVAVDELPRSLPHDLANALAATAAAFAAGATLDACRSVLVSFRGLPHRITFVRDAGGVRYYDDSKATTPASVLAAVAGFESVVLIAGGLNKDLDLSVLGAAVPPVRSVVAIGNARDQVAAAFRGAVPVTIAHSMDEAVAVAASLADPGDVVLLSPGCASFDQFDNYAHRGNEFARAVRALPVGAERG